LAVLADVKQAFKAAVSSVTPSPLAPQFKADKPPIPRFDNAPAAVVAPVPPLAIATVPVTFVAVAALPPMLSPAAVPVSPEPAPLKLDAVTVPEKLAEVPEIAPVNVAPESEAPPRFDNAPAAVVAPVPPWLIGHTVPSPQPEIICVDGYRSLIVTGAGYMFGDTPPLITTSKP
jgi:hypothetical protein